jgi:RNA ligase (TIGR02306 family)
MSFFAVTKEIIEDTFPILNADVIEMATLVGSSFEFVIKKNQFKKGDEVLYFPLDSLLPEWLLEKLELSGKLNGKNKNRIKTVKLRGQISQGIVTDLSLLDNWNEQNQTITEFLEVIKYEVPAILIKNANLVSLPIGLSVYDIEGVDKYVEIGEILKLQLVEITEKLEGSNFSVTYSNLDNKIYVNQRKHSIQPIEGDSHAFWEIAHNQKIIDFVNRLHETFTDSNITVYGEFIGPQVQSNIYKLQQFQVKLFDIKINDKWLEPDMRQILIELYFGNLDNHVPILATNVCLKEWLNNKSFSYASHGLSQLNKNIIREGIVIKPMIESRHEKIGRLIIKQRDPIYLVKEK